MNDATTPTPKPSPGAELVALRKREGVSQKAVAEALGIHRTRLNAWESESEVDTIRAERYRRAVAQLVAEAIAS